MSTNKNLNETLKGICNCDIADSKDKAGLLAEYAVRSKILKADSGTFYLKKNNLLTPMSDMQTKSILKSMILPEQRLMIKSSEISETLERLRDFEEIQIDIKELKLSTKSKINLLNGVYDIKSKKLEKTSPDILFTYVLNFNYIENASIDKAPVFKHFTETSIGKENLDCFLEMAGYSFSSLTDARKSFFLIGNEKCGKSLSIDLMEYAVGEENTSAVPLSQMGTEQSKIKYIGSKLNLSRETSSKAMRNDDAFKSLVSSEKVTGRRLYENSKEFVPETKFIFASNFFPDFKNLDTAILDRIIPIYFKDRVAEKVETNLNLKDELIKEIDIIFSLALDKLKKLIESGYQFSLSDTSKEILSHKRKEILNTSEFISENFTLDSTEEISSVQLYNSYQKWCENNGIVAEGKKIFYSKVKEFSITIKYTKVMVNGKKVNGFKGLKKLCDYNDFSDDVYSKIPKRNHSKKSDTNN